MKILKVFVIILLRLITLPFVTGLQLVACVRYTIISMYNYMVYGGEMIEYNKKINRKSIKEVYDKIQNKI